MAGGDDDGVGAADIALVVDIGSPDLDAGEVLGFGEDGPCEQLMTAPGIGPRTALAFVATIDQSGSSCVSRRRLRTFCRKSSDRARSSASVSRQPPLISSTSDGCERGR